MILKLQRNIAFTLAEVLITLGIIGIVAAMTLPVISAHYRKKEISVRLQKFSSTMQSAFNRATIDYGPIQNWKYPTKQNDPEQINEFVMTYLFPYLQGLKICMAGDNACENIQKGTFTGRTDNSMPIYIFPDGSCFTLIIGGAGASYTTIHYSYDYNCIGKPNKANIDIFRFVTRLVYNKGKLFAAGDWQTYNINDRDTLLEYCKASSTDFNVSSSYNGSCTKLLEYDGWEIKDDYPWIK